MQRVIELALETPLELRSVEVPRMQVEVVGVHRNDFIFELDDDLDAVAFGPRGESSAADARRDEVARERAPGELRILASEDCKS